MYSFMRFGGFSSYGRGGMSSDEEEETSDAFRVRGNQAAEQAGTAVGAGPVTAGSMALARALDEEEDGADAASAAAAGRIALETEVDDGLDVDAAIAAQLEKLCVECQDQPATLMCNQCADKFCAVCFAAMHKRGTRAKHTTAPYAAGQQLDAVVSSTHDAAAAAAAAPAAMDDVPATSSTPAPVAASAVAAALASAASDEVSDDMLEAQYSKSKAAATATSALSEDDEEEDIDDNSSSASSRSAAGGPIVLPSRAMQSSLVSGPGPTLRNGLPADWFLQRAQFIPLRLTLEERKYLRLLESALNVSMYTDKVDIVSSKAKSTRIKEQLRDICSILSGLLVAHDYRAGAALVKDKNFEDNAVFFQSVFELGRRHKIRNPEKMRNGYGKLCLVIQDSVIPQITELMGFNLHSPLRTVYRELEAADALDLLRDERMMLATGDIQTHLPDGSARPRPDIERDIKHKNAAVDFLAKRYCNAKIDEENTRACILSIADNATFLLQNRRCCDDMLEYLTKLYDADKPRTPAHSLAILGGRNGARLTHSHASQFSYVMQSLVLWREILHDMFRLWVCTEGDLFDPENPYRLRNTGQGLNRVQAAPRVGKSMHNILHQCQQKLGSWVGSSVVHLGDHNVPNALTFIDKYTQVSRILNPIVLTLKAIPRLCEKPDIAYYIQRVFGGPEQLKMLILTDFFRHAFDGSGADSFFDAGSCIDGRLTSAWNWCNKIEKKSFYTVFQLSGFASFDGQWSD